MMWGFYGGPWWWMLFGGLSMLVFWGAIIWLVVWGVKQFAGGLGGGISSQEAPLEIAQRRLARGEITREQYEELKEALQ